MTGYLKLQEAWKMCNNNIQANRMFMLKFYAELKVKLMYMTYKTWEALSAEAKNRNLN